MKITPILITLFIISPLLHAAVTEQEELKIKLERFFSPVDSGMELPADKIYPEGRIMPFMGYSGKNETDAKNGFTVGGHHYGALSKQPEKLANAKAAGLPYIYGVGLEGSFHKKENPIKFTEESLKAEIKKQVLAVADDPFVLWWYVKPEELRMWRKNEKEYLRIVTETIRETDPEKRPVWMYDPNHRNSDGLKATGAFLDIIGKGCYVNLAGYEADRSWVRWTIDQETTACRELEKQDSKKRTPILMPQLSQDPFDPEDDKMIATWVRHDIYLGLMSGAKGVAIWSLFKRRGVKRTHHIFYEAYATVAQELKGPDGLGEVFLFGEDKNDLTITQTLGPKTIELFTGPRNKLEDGTISEAEKKKHTFNYPALATREISFAGKRYLFLCNSTRENLACEISGFPGAGIKLEEHFSKKPHEIENQKISLDFKPWEARCILITKQ